MSQAFFPASDQPVPAAGLNSCPASVKTVAMEGHSKSWKDIPLSEPQSLHVKGNDNGLSTPEGPDKFVFPTPLVSAQVSESHIVGAQEVFAE